MTLKTPSYRFWFVAMALAAVAVPVLWAAGAGLKAQAACLCLLFLLIFMAWRSVRRPLNAMQNGMNLLREQDYSSRLRTVGQVDADRVVELFNSLMENMKRERLRLEEQNRFLDMLIEASPSGIAICNFDGSVRSCNGAFHSMVTPAVTELLGSLADGESRVCRPGQSQILRCSRRSFADSGFRRPFFMVDRLTDEIVQAEKDVFNKMVRTISHEVNNSLGSVVSVLDTMATLHQAEPTVADVLETSRRSCEALCAFTRGYAAVAKLPAPEPEKLDLGDFVNELLPVLRGLCSPGITLETINEGPAEVMADPMLFERVLVNLVKNAVESIGEREGRVRVLTSAGRLVVEDNGPGLTEEAARCVFTPFFSTKHRDSGLGLMLVADILRSHRMSFSLSTDPSDELTRFVINYK